MKRLLVLSLMIVLPSCASTMNSHRMKAAQRKMLDTRKLQQASQWDAALAMAERMHASVSKSISSAPMQRSAAGSLIDVQPMLTAWEKGPFTDLKTALHEKDAGRSATAFSSLRQQCINCHVVLGKSQIQVAGLP